MESKALRSQLPHPTCFLSSPTHLICRLFATLKDPRTFKAQYRVTTWTSDIRGAGTDANVFIQIYGDEAETGRINLDNPLVGKGGHQERL